MISNSACHRSSNPFVNNNTNDFKGDAVKIIFKGLCVIGIIAITILAGSTIPGTINSLRESIGKTFIYTDYIRSVNGYIIPVKYAQEFTTVDYYVSLLGLSILSGFGLALAGFLITEVLKR